MHKHTTPTPRLGALSRPGETPDRFSLAAVLGHRDAQLAHLLDDTERPGEVRR